MRAPHCNGSGAGSGAGNAGDGVDGASVCGHKLSKSTTVRRSCIRRLVCVFAGNINGACVGVGSACGKLCGGDLQHCGLCR